MKTLFKLFLATSLCLAASQGLAQTLWQENLVTPNLQGQQINAKASDARYVSFQPETLRKQFLQADGRLSINVPAPDGKNISVTLVEDSVMEPGLAARFPGIKSFKALSETGQQIGRFSFSHKGLHGMYLHNNEWAYLDPLYLNQTTEYISYYRKNARPLTKQSFNEDLSRMLQSQAQQVRNEYKELRASTGDTLTTYRLAVSTTGEYTQFHKSDPDAEFGTVADGIAALNATVTRVNQVYLADVAVAFVLVDNNDQIVFTDPSTDPFNNDSNDIGLNQEVVDNAIGTENYDVGHVFTSSDGGVAELGSVCTSLKAEGLTGLPAPTGDAFNIDYVSHELGHQFDATHTFNGTEGACVSRSLSVQTAYEPGSGATIMGYAGPSLCGTQSLQDNSEALFHIGSVEQIRDFIDNGVGGTCGTQSAIDNTQPTISAGTDYTIPARTPFKLTGEGNDADDDTLVYNWEQFDLGTASSGPETMVDDGSRPLFRTWASTSEPTRYFPRLSDVLANTTAFGETYPTTSRTMNFRLTVRDSKGGLSTDGMQLTTVANGSGFSLLQPSSLVSWGAGSNVILMWNPSGSADAPVSCSTLDLDISSDGGINFTSFANNIANDGVTTVIAPSSLGSNYRLKLNCSDNVFFAVHQADFAVVDADSITDSDGDGIPDEWETANGLDPNDASDAAADADTDGLSNLEEYLLSTNPNNTDSDGDGVSDLLDAIRGNLTSFSFENDTDITNFNLGTENSWSVTEATAFDGTKSLVGADISDDETTSFTYTGEFIAGDLNFYAKVSSEVGYDFLQFYIDDQLQDAWSGSVDWFVASFAITAGEHTLRWQFTKDGSVTEGQDTGWVDLVSLPLVSSTTDPDPDPDPDPEPEPTPFVAFDYDGDSKADVGVRRPSNFHQYIRNSSDDDIQRVVFGRALGDIPISGDFDGDKIADVAVRRASNQLFYIKNSSDGVIQRFNFGRNSADIPVPADYDGDGITDVAVRRASTQTWYIRNSSGVDALTNNADGITRLRFGLQEDDIPVVADYDGDGKADIAVRRANSRFWYVKNSSGVDAVTNNADGITRLRFGLQEADIAVPADYDGDGKADFAVRRPSNFTWYIRNSSGVDPINNDSDGISRVVFGRDEGDIPIPADYDGDGKADIAVRRPSNFIQYILRSSDREISREELGKQTTDIPLAAPVLTRMSMASAAADSDG